MIRAMDVVARVSPPVPRGRFPLRGVALAAAVAMAGAGGAAVLGPVSAAAQSADTQALLNRVDRLQRELTTLQQQVYRGGAPAGAPAQDPSTAQVFANAPNLAAAMEVRLQQLSSEIRDLTGRVQKVEHSVSTLSAKVDKLYSDTDMRLKALESGRGGAPGQANGEVAQGEGDRDAGPSGEGGGAPQNTPNGGEPGVLGTLSPEDLKAGAAPAPGGARPQPQAQAQGEAGAQVAALPPGDAKQQYKYATGLLIQQDYEKAERALKAFLDAHPKDELAGNAQYWLGETYYVRGNYDAAARAFAKGYKDYPKSQKGPANLLKLGMSLAALHKTAAACATFQRLQQDYPAAPANISSIRDSEAKKLKCQ